jgi:asparagine synthase (glutamine-hydrolysing)
MCGFAGLLHFNAESPEPETIIRMTDCIAHRGPDDAGQFADGPVVLGFRRLSIIDLKDGGQPLGNEDGSIWTVFNGEIYNYRELRGELEKRGHRFRTAADTEVIVHLYEEFGMDGVEKLNGMYSFAIWDRKERTLCAARDPFGIKPFYYWSDHDRFLFSSEIKAILAAGVQPQLDRDSLWNYLTFQFVPEPDTMFRHIKKLPPGHWMRVSPEGQIRLQKHWRFGFEPEPRPLGDYVEQIRETLRSSVEAHMQADVECGCFLSSGIDSTAIAALMSKRYPVKTFSVGFEGEQNETEIARRTAEALGVPHYSQVIGEQDYFDSIPKAVWHQDDPVADPSAVALFHLSKLASEHVKVVLSGEGADELFGGYRIYREPRALAPFAWMPLPVKRWMNRTAARLPQFRGKNYLLRGTTPLEERYIGNAKIFNEEMKEDLLVPCSETPRIGPTELVAPYYRECAQLPPVSRMQWIDLHFWLPGDILMKADKMSMAHSLEVRVPFLDKRVLDLARRIPAHYLIGGNTTKYVFRKAMEGIVPEFVRSRPKLGFPVPIRRWIRGRRGDEMLELIRGSGLEQIFNLPAVERLLAMHRANQGDYSRHLWTVFIFAWWHKIFMGAGRQGSGDGRLVRGA